MVPTIGVVFPPWYPPEQLRDAAVAAEQAGVEQLWLWEDCFKESGIAAAAASLAWTERLTLAIGLTPAPLRNVALLAMEVATLERLFPGRFIPVVGHGVQSWMGQVGARVESPLALLREYVVALDQLLRGETVTTSGRYVSLDAVALDWPPLQPVPVRVGGVGPKTLELLGEVAGGVLLDSGNSPSDVRAALDVVARGAAAAGRDLPPISMFVTTVRGDDAVARLASYQGESTGDPDTEKGLAGDAGTVAAGVRRYAEAGVGTVILRPPEDEPDIVDYIRWVGAEVVPRIPA
jgi:alkanesulfonate monooxygenase SsuD/methylene tetrahydromethanopterin reductase-like flavin-dependent oxidoreductase (luciferase family)